MQFQMRRRSVLSPCLLKHAHDILPPQRASANSKFSRILSLPRHCLVLAYPLAISAAAAARHWQAFAPNLQLLLCAPVLVPACCFQYTCEAQKCLRLGAAETLSGEQAQSRQQQAGRSSRARDQAWSLQQIKDSILSL